MAAVGEAIREIGAARWRERLRRVALGYAFNPLLVRDLRSVTRGRRTLALQVGYLLVAIMAMGIAALGCRQARLMAARYGTGFAPSYGETMFLAMFETQVVLLLLVVVGYSAGAIAMEQEKRTFEMLAVTTLSALEIVLGKVMAITALCALLLTTSLPLAAICLVLGGVSVGQILGSYALLLYGVPMWAAGCVLISILVGRTVGAYVTAMVGMTLLQGLAAALSAVDETLSFGVISPFLLPVPEAWVGFELFNLTLPAWWSPVILQGLWAALFVVAAAEAMPLHRARRSTALRTLLLATVFASTFLFFAAGVQQTLQSYAARGATQWGGSWRSGSATALLKEFSFGLILAWILACLSVPVFSSYPPPRAAYRRPLAWLLGATPRRQWFRREANVGWRSTLLLFGTSAVGMILPYLIAEWMGLASGRIFTDRTVAMLLFAMMLYALSLLGYSFWGAAFALAWRERMLAGLFAALAILLLNTLALFGEISPLAFRKAQFLLHPALVMTSPLPAANAALGGGAYGHYWRAAWRNPAVLFGLSVCYQVAIAAAGVWYLRRVGVRGQGSGGGEDG